MFDENNPIHQAISTILGHDYVQSSREKWSEELKKHASLSAARKILNQKVMNTAGQFVTKHKAAFGAGGVGGAAMTVPEVSEAVSSGGRRIYGFLRRGNTVSDAFDQQEISNDVPLPPVADDMLQGGAPIWQGTVQPYPTDQLPYTGHDTPHYTQPKPSLPNSLSASGEAIDKASVADTNDEMVESSSRRKLPSPASYVDDVVRGALLSGRDAKARAAKIRRLR